VEGEKAIEPFMKENGFTFPVLLDKKGEIAQSFGVHALPVTFLIGRKGNLLAKSLGYKDWHAEKSRQFFISLLKEEGMDSHPIQVKVQAKETSVSNKGSIQNRWLFSGVGVLILALGAFLLWIRKARLHRK